MIINVLEWINLHWYNADMRKLSFFSSILIVMAVFLLSACSQVTENLTITPTITPPGTLRPYPSSTATATALPTGYSSPTPSPTMTLTPTPVYYEVQLGDDMYSIAFRYNLSPAAIMTANPTVNPRAMIVGMSLLIPITPTVEPTQGEMSESTPTMVSSEESGLGEPVCYLETLGGLWCFVLFENETEGALENVSALVNLTDGETTRQEIAIMPLNLLPEGESLPLIAYFDGPVSPDYTVSVAVDFSLPVMAEDDRYLSVDVLDQSINLNDDGNVATVLGHLALAEGQPDADYLWLAATAYDSDGRVVAFRRWEWNQTVVAGESLDFNLNLYSLGGMIDRVDVLTEAHRVYESTETPEN